MGETNARWGQIQMHEKYAYEWCYNITSFARKQWHKKSSCNVILQITLFIHFIPCESSLGNTFKSHFVHGMGHRCHPASGPKLNSLLCFLQSKAFFIKQHVTIEQYGTESLKNIMNRRHLANGARTTDPITPFSRFCRRRFILSD